jgi:hypothetical protein
LIRNLGLHEPDIGSFRASLLNKHGALSLIERVAALCAALIIGLLPVAWVSAASAETYERSAGAPLLTSSPLSASPEMAVLSGTSSDGDLTDMPPLPRPERTPAPKPTAAREQARQRQPTTPPPAPVVSGIASNYPGTAGFAGQAVVALPGALGGRYTGAVQGYVTVCADRCVRLPVVDWCQCYWGTAEQRVADISQAAWPLISDQPLSMGLIEVRVILDDPNLAAAWTG